MSIKDARIAIAVVGAPGLIGKRHVQHVIDDESETYLSCIVDPFPAGLEYGRSLNVPVYASVQDMLSARLSGQVKVDGAIVATPNHTHSSLGIELLKAGVHVLVEKPISDHVTSARALLEAEKASHGAKLLVGHHRRFNPYIIAAKAALDEQVLGRVLAVTGQWTLLKDDEYYSSVPWRVDAHSGGPILINLVHDIDLLRYLFGDITRVYCEKGDNIRKYPVEETGAIVLKFASGAIGTFVFSDAVASPYNFESATGENPLVPPTHENIYHIMGTKGSMAFPELGVFSYVEKQGENEQNFTENGASSLAGGSWKENLKVNTRFAESVKIVPPFTIQLRHFVKVCKGEEVPNCSGLEGLTTLMTVDAVKQSLKTGQFVELVDLPFE